MYANADLPKLQMTFQERKRTSWYARRGKLQHNCRMVGRLGPHPAWEACSRNSPASWVSLNMAPGCSHCSDELTKLLMVCKYGFGQESIRQARLESWSIKVETRPRAKLWRSSLSHWFKSIQFALRTLGHPGIARNSRNSLFLYATRPSCGHLPLKVKMVRLALCVQAY